MRDFRLKKGFTLVEVLVAAAVMVFAFTLIAIIFSKAHTLISALKRESKADRWAITLMNTILYGPGTSNIEALMAACKVYYPPDSAAADDTNYPTIFNSYKSTDATGRSRFLAFSTVDGKPLIYDIANLATVCSMYRSIFPGAPFDETNPSGGYVDLKPQYAKDGDLEVYYDSGDLVHSSGFYFYDEYNNPVTATEDIKRVGIKLVIKNTLQSLSRASIIYQNIRIMNLYCLD